MNRATETPCFCPRCSAYDSCYLTVAVAPEWMDQEQVEAFEADSDPVLACSVCGMLEDF